MDTGQRENDREGRKGREREVERERKMFRETERVKYVGKREKGDKKTVLTACLPKTACSVCASNGTSSHP